MKTKRFQHTPDSAARAIRRLVNDQIPQTIYDFADKINAFQVYQLVKEQCGIETSTPEIRDAIEGNFPELFADYWENLVSSP